MDQNMIEAVADLGKTIEFLDKDAVRLQGMSDAFRDDGTVKPSTLAEFYFHVHALHEQADNAVKKLYHVKDFLNKSLIPQRLKDAGLDAIRVPAVARSFSIVTKTSATMVDKERGLEWLREQGQGEMIQETVNAGTLSAFCRNLILERGIDPPDDIIKVSTYDTLSMVKYKPTAGEA